MNSKSLQLIFWIKGTCSENLVKKYEKFNEYELFLCFLSENTKFNFKFPLH